MNKTPTDDVKSGTRDEIEGSAKILAGKIKEGAGKVLGNPRLEGRGDSEQLVGAIQREFGKLKKVLGK
jgi:uncharacterized protein YjbJ (UPF0337 family)